MSTELLSIFIIIAMMIDKRFRILGIIAGACFIILHDIPNVILILAIILYGKSIIERIQSLLK